MTLGEYKILYHSQSRSGLELPRREKVCRAFAIFQTVEARFWIFTLLGFDINRYDSDPGSSESVLEDGWEPWRVAVWMLEYQLQSKVFFHLLHTCLQVICILRLTVCSHAGSRTMKVGPLSNLSSFTGREALIELSNIFEGCTDEIRCWSACAHLLGMCQWNTGYKITSITTL